jgi:hypothetical protein
MLLRLSNKAMLWRISGGIGQKVIVTPFITELCADRFCCYVLLAYCSISVNVSCSLAMVTETVETVGSATATRLRGVTVMDITVFLFSTGKTSDPAKLQNCYRWLPYFEG